MRFSAKEFLERKFVLVVLFLIICNLSFSQETKLVQKKDCTNDSISEEYSVLKRDNTIKHGIYSSYFCQPNYSRNLILNDSALRRNFVREHGIYVEGVKDGYWITNIMPYRLKEEGKYMMGKKVGVWVTGKKLGSEILLEHYNYTTNEKMSPDFIVWLKYPLYAQENEIQGEVELSYEVETDCTISDIMITKSIGGGCDEEAKRKTIRYYQLKKQYSCKCEQELKRDKIKFSLE